MSFVLVLLIAGADGSASARATALFTEGRAAMKTKDYAAACEAFQKSHQLDPALGTLLNWSDCLEKRGKLADAWLHFNEAASWADRTKEADRATLARDRSQALKPMLAWLTLTSAAEEEVRVDGTPVKVGSAPISVPVDAGAHTIEAFESAERTAWRTLVESKRGETTRVAIPSRARAVAVAPVPVVEPERVELKPEPVTTAPSVAARVTPRPSMVGPVVLGIAGALVMAGSVGLGWTFARYDALQLQKNYGTSSGVSVEDLKTMQWLYPASWASLGVGLAGIVVGSLFMKSAPVSVGVSVSSGSGAVSFSGAF